MSLESKINLALAISSFLLSAISMIFVVITIKQNSKMIENANRPYLVFYSGKTLFSQPMYYVILKNFGNSSAKVTSLKISSDLKQLAYIKEVLPFQSLEGTYIAPSQSIQTVLNSKGSGSISICFDIEYESSGKKYIDHFELNPKAEMENTITRSHSKNNELESIFFALQDISEKLL